MGLMDIAKEAGSKITGISDKAYIIFYTRNSEPGMQENHAGGINDLGKGTLGLAAAGRALASTGADLANTAVAEEGREGKKYALQFNPLKISINGLGGGNYAISTYGAQGDGSAGKANASRVTVSIDILFDDVNNLDAFAEDKLNATNAAGAASALATGINKGLGRSYTVRPQVEGFHAAMRIFDRTLVKFVWGNQSYEGELIGFNSKYIMFSPTGNPIRATGTMNILCTDYQREIWARNTKNFTDNWSGASTMKAGQYASGLLNI